MIGAHHGMPAEDVSVHINEYPAHFFGKPENRKLWEGLYKEWVEFSLRQTGVCDISELKESEEKRYGHQKMRIYEDFVEGKLSREQYLQEKVGIEEHLAELSAQITVAKKTIEELSVKGQEDHTEINENQRFEEYRGAGAV